MSEKLPEPRYIGDGVYVSYDGYQVWLSISDHTNKVVALEKEVFDALLQFVGPIWFKEKMN